MVSFFLLQFTECVCIPIPTRTHSGMCNFLRAGRFGLHQSEDASSAMPKRVAEKF